MTDLEKATFYIVGYFDGNLAAIGLRDPFDEDGGTTEENTIEPHEVARLETAMRKRIRKQYPSLTDADIDAAYTAASLTSLAYIPTPERQAQLNAEVDAELAARRATGEFPTA
jgi:hypothetical protein